MGISHSAQHRGTQVFFSNVIEGQAYIIVERHDGSNRYDHYYFRNDDDQVAREYGVRGEDERVDLIAFTDELCRVMIASVNHH